MNDELLQKLWNIYGGHVYEDGDIRIHHTDLKAAIDRIQEQRLEIDGLLVLNKKVKRELKQEVKRLQLATTEMLSLDFQDAAVVFQPNSVELIAPMVHDFLEIVPANVRLASAVYMRATDDDGWERDMLSWLEAIQKAEAEEETKDAANA